MERRTDGAWNHAPIDAQYSGTATVTVTGKGGYAGTAKATFMIAKAKNPAKVTAKQKTAKLSKVKKKAQALKPLTVKKAQGKVTYSKVAKGSSKKLTVNKKTGKVTVKKGTKKGTQDRGQGEGCREQGLQGAHQARDGESEGTVITALP